LLVVVGFEFLLKVKSGGPLEKKKKKKSTYSFFFFLSKKSDFRKKIFLTSGVTFLVKEYQQLLADALAIAGISQPAVELDWLTQHVQYKIQEFNTLLVRRSGFLFSLFLFFSLDDEKETRESFFASLARRNQ
jgi:hypothetical protein